MNPTTRPQCLTCLWYIATSTPHKGQCRAHPPTPISACHSHFPEVSQSWWCGEWKEKPAAAVPEEVIPAKGSGRNRKA